MKIVKRKLNCDKFWIDFEKKEDRELFKFEGIKTMGLVFVILFCIVFWVYIISLDKDYLFLSMRILPLSIPFYLVYYFKIEK